MLHGLRRSSKFRYWAEFRYLVNTPWFLWDRLLLIMVKYWISPAWTYSSWTNCLWDRLCRSLVRYRQVAHKFNAHIPRRHVMVGSTSVEWVADPFASKFRSLIQNHVRQVKGWISLVNTPCPSIAHKFNAHIPRMTRWSLELQTLSGSVSAAVELQTRLIRFGES